MIYLKPYSTKFHNFISPSSLQDANNPGILGFHVTQFTSCPCDFSAEFTRVYVGAFGSSFSSSLNIRTISSPQAVAMSPVSLHQFTS